MTTAVCVFRVRARARFTRRSLAKQFNKYMYVLHMYSICVHFLNDPCARHRMNSTPHACMQHQSSAGSATSSTASTKDGDGGALHGCHTGRFGCCGAAANVHDWNAASSVFVPRASFKFMWMAGAAVCVCVRVCVFDCCGDGCRGLLLSVNNVVVVVTGSFLVRSRDVWARSRGSLMCTAAHTLFGWDLPRCRRHIGKGRSRRRAH